MKRSPIVMVVVALVVTIMLVAGITFSRHSKGGSGLTGHTGPAGKGQIAPDFTLQSLDGKKVRLSDFRGKAVLLNFWATWCEPCKLEMPWFVDLQKNYGPQGLQIVGVAMDDASTQEIAQFAKELKVNYVVLVGQESVREDIGSAYGGVQFLPSTFYIGRDGKIVNRIFGLKGRGEIEEEVKKMLAQGQVTQARN